MTCLSYAISPRQHIEYNAPTISTSWVLVKNIESPDGLCIQPIVGAAGGLCDPELSTHDCIIMGIKLRYLLLFKLGTRILSSYGRFKDV